MSLKVSQWIIGLYQKSPRVATVAMLLLAIGVLWPVFWFTNKEYIHSLEVSREQQAIEISNLKADNKSLNARMTLNDSLFRVQLFQIQEKANNEVHDFMASQIARQDRIIVEQQQAERQRRAIITTNQRVINKGHSIITNLQDDQH